MQFFTFQCQSSWLPFNCSWSCKNIIFAWNCLFSEGVIRMHKFQIITYKFLTRNIFWNDTKEWFLFQFFSFRLKYTKQSGWRISSVLFNQSSLSKSLWQLFSKHLRHYRNLKNFLYSFFRLNILKFDNKTHDIS